MSDRTRALYDCVYADLRAAGCGEALDYYSVAKQLAPDFSPRQVAGVLFAESFYKKYVEATAKDADDKALTKFLATNSRCAEWELDLQSSWDEVLWGTFKQVVYEYFYPRGEPLITSTFQLLERGRLGPGASVGARAGDFYTKLFDSPLAVTRQYLYDEYRAYVRRTPTWQAAEEQRFANWAGPNIVDTSGISFVPKNSEISRVIFKEPSLNMMYQLGLEDLMRERLNQFFWIDLEDQQSVNRELARLGSVDGSFVTIDLSSASDSISLKMLEQVLPNQVNAWFQLIRTPRAVMPNGEELQLHMISTMGNGFTFPLQTVLFAAMVEAASRCSGDRYPFKRVPIRHRVGLLRQKAVTYGVNGDDIICEGNLSRDVLRLLTLAGFTVNASKTFLEGQFRESCGGDYFQGHYVRGVFVKDLSSAQSRFVVINQINHWSARTGISMSRTVQFLLKTVRFQPVPFMENDDAGIKVPYGFIANSRAYDKGKQAVKYRRSCSVPARLLVTECEIIAPNGAKMRRYNPNGLLACFLNGDLIGVSGRPPVVKRKGKPDMPAVGTLSVRHDARRYHTNEAVTPHWDWIRPDPKVVPMLADDGGIAPSSYWQRWESAVHYNHFG